MWHQNVPSPLLSRASLYTECEEQGCGGWIGVDGAYMKGEITNYLEKYAGVYISFFDFYFLNVDFLVIIVFVFWRPQRDWKITIRPR